MMFLHKETLKIAFVGEVDHGKSTLIGRLLLENRFLPEERLSEAKKIAKELGEDSALAFLVDQLKEEREQLRTIDAAHVYLRSSKRNYILIDTPGHQEFLKNMLTGTTEADAACLIIDASRGLEKQAKQHLHLFKILAVAPILAVITKMDLVDYDEKLFLKIKNDLVQFSRALGLPMEAVIPLSSLEGENIIRPGRKMPWYRGPALLPALGKIKRFEEKSKKAPLRFPIQDIYRIGNEEIIVGKALSGVLKKGQKLVVLPSYEEVTVKEIRVFESKRTKAFPEESVGLILSPSGALRRGDILACKDLPEVKNHFSAQVLWLADEPLINSNPISVRLSTQEIDGSVCLEKDSLNKNEWGRVSFNLRRPLVAEKFSLNPSMGRFTLQNGRRTGIGIIS